MLVKHTQFLDWLATEHDQAHEVIHLLERDQYEQVAAKLGAILPLDDPAANRILTHTLLVMRTVCQSLHLSQRETDWHHWALQNVKARETELRAGLYAILELADEIVDSNRQPSASLAPSAAQPDVPIAQSVIRLLHPHRLLRRHRDRSAVRNPQVMLGALAQAEYDMTVYALGSFRFYIGDTLLDSFATRKGEAIFKYLLLNRERPVHKERLLDVIWSDVEDSYSFDRLNGAIYSLRQAFRQVDSERHIILYEHGHYRLNPELRIWIDYEAFEHYCQHARGCATQAKHEQELAAYEAAVMLYRGALLAEYPFMEWVEFERQKLQGLYTTALDRLSEAQLLSGDALACQATCQRLLEVDPCNEAAHLRLMQLYARSGQKQLAHQQYQLLSAALKSEGLTPSLEAAALNDQIRNGVGG
jgi:DNA-binding SARP family transcriptional activator